MYLVIDSNLLHGRMKIESQELESIHSISQKIGWQILLPEPCKIEVINGAKEKHGIANELFQKANKEAQNYFMKSSHVLTSYEEFINDFEARLNIYLKEKKIGILPFTQKKYELKDLFIPAVNKSPPFDKTGNNFRDAAIWLSVVEFATSVKEEILFLTRDNRFEGMTKQTGLMNLSSKDMESGTKYLTEKLGAAEQNRLERISKEVAVLAVEDNFVNLVEQKAVKDLDFNIDESNGKLISIDEISITHLGNVENISQANHCQVTVIGKLTYTFKYFAYMKEARQRALRELASRPTKIGQKRVEPQELKQASGGISRLLHPQSIMSQNEVTEQLSKYVVLDLIAKFTEANDAVTSIEMISLNLSDHNAYEYVDIDGNAHG